MVTSRLKTEGRLDAQSAPWSTEQTASTAKSITDTPDPDHAAPATSPTQGAVLASPGTRRIIRRSETNEGQSRPMRPNQNRRMRGRNRPKGPNPLTRSYESNGPDVKIRGTAQHIADKYAQLARDAQASGDPVAAENYFQHGEHYFRIISGAQEQTRQQVGGYARGFDDEGRRRRRDGQNAPAGLRRLQLRRERLQRRLRRSGPAAPAAGLRTPAGSAPGGAVLRDTARITIGRTPTDRIPARQQPAEPPRSLRQS